MFPNLRLPTLSHTICPAPERVASVVAQALVSLGKSVGLFAHTVQDLTFGVDSCPPRPFHQVVAMYVNH